MNEEKKMVQERRCLFSGGYFDGDTLQDAVTNMKSYFEGMPEGARLEYDYDTHYYTVVYTREETDAEYARRVHKMSTDESIQESAEKRKLRELMQKYPDVASEAQKQG